MNNFLISIIIPSYNVEKYIVKCLESILSQTYKNIQVIVVDDLSKDNTCNIVESIAQRDNRVVLYKSETNNGSAMARQIGVDISSGELLTFVDADDCYNTDVVLEKVVKEFSENSVDCVMFGYRTIHGNLTLNKKFSSRIGLYTAQDIFIEKIKNKDAHWHYLWNKVYKSEIVKNNVRFLATLRRAEDARFNADFLKVATSFKVIPDLFYDYNCSNPNQVTRSKKESKSTTQSHRDYYQHIVRVLDDLLSQVEYYNVSHELKGILYSDFYKKSKRLFSRLDNTVASLELKRYIECESHFIDSKNNMNSMPIFIDVLLCLEGSITFVKRFVKFMLNSVKI